MRRCTDASPQRCRYERGIGLAIRLRDPHIGVIVDYRPTIDGACP
jgi:hypothetical protein